MRDFEEQEAKHRNTKTKKSQNNESTHFDGVILTVAHREFADFHINGLLNDNGVVYDVKGVLEEWDERL